MTILRRLSAAIMTATLALASIGAGDQTCVSHAPAAANAAMHHVGTMDGTTVPEMPNGSAAGSECEDCAHPAPSGPPADAVPPCDHQSMARDCSSMISCVTVVAEVQRDTRALPDLHTGRVRSILSGAPASVALPPETPPPRV